MAYSITKKQLSAQPVLQVTRREVKRPEIAKAIGEGLPLVAAYAQRNGIAVVGPPFARYTEMGPNGLTMEIGMPVASASSTSDSDVKAAVLPAGPAAATTHFGHYDKLPEAVQALDQWIRQQGLTPGGGPWESYVTDPGNHPDPKDWKTEVFWPVSG